MAIRAHGVEKARRNRLWAGTAFSVAAITGGVVLSAGMAQAEDVGTAQVEAYAPNASAAAEVSSKGTLAKSKNVPSVDHPREGIYCVRVDLPTESPKMSLALSVPIAGLTAGSEPGGSAQVATWATTHCDSTKATMTVTTFDRDGKPADKGFNLVLP